MVTECSRPRRISYFAEITPHAVLCCLTGKGRFARRRCPGGAWGFNRMGEDKRAVLPHRVPHAGGPKIPHGPHLPSEPADRPSPGSGAAALLEQLLYAAARP